MTNFFSDFCKVSNLDFFLTEMMIKEKHIGRKAFDLSKLDTNEKNFEDYQIEKPILIVGRDYETRLLLKTLLELWNYQTVESHTVGEAGKFLEFCQPKLVLLDSDLAFSETLENIYLIRQNKQLLALPLVVMSGYCQKNYRDLAMSNGANGYLVKPLNFAHMERMLNALAESKIIAQGGNL